MKSYLYIRAEVVATDPEAVALIDSLAEHVDGQPRPDIIPQIHASGISFRHVFLWAGDEADAYLRGWPLLGEPTDGAICNDYVVELKGTHE